MRKEEYPEILLVEEVADYLRVNKQTIYNLLRQGELPAKKIGGQWRFHKKAVEEYVKRGDNLFTAATVEE